MLNIYAMNPFEHISYREYLKLTCRNPENERGLQAKVAKAAGCQASYLSQVLQENAHLTEDQALGICDYLELSERETNYFLLLLRFEKASTTKLKKYLENQIQYYQKENEHIGQKVPAEKTLLKDEDIGRYFSSWIPSAVHLLTSSPDFGTAKSISQRLNLPLKNIEESLNYLHKLGYIEKKDGRWIYKGGSIHIPKDSHWQPAVQESRRQLAMRSIAVNPEEVIHFSSIFTIDQKDVEEIKRLIKPFLDKSHQVIQKSGSEELYCMCLDLFVVI